MNDQGKEKAWQEIQDRVDELLRQSLAGNFFYRIEYGSTTHQQGIQEDDKEPGRARKP
ncbi:MAG TPA: hypothetical protein VLZ07_03140 [Syntrophales bacterium]|nr:hypothetical protein [Syntrophales bacterium]